MASVPPAPPESPWLKWMIVAAVMSGTIMEVIDTSAANVALPHIAGDLGAGVDESTWVLTSYLVSNGVVLPLTGWFGIRFGRKRFFLFCQALFILSSMACGMAPNLMFLVFFRVLQGAGGGALIPISQAILMETFPPAQQGMAMALFGVGVMFGPIIGPTLGGYITDNYNWRWVFYINLPVGIVALILGYLLLSDPPYLKKLKAGKLDTFGLAALCVAVGCLQVMLDKGEREDWFNTDWIVYLAIVSLVAFIVFGIYELFYTKEPIVDLRVFKDNNFRVGTFLIFSLGFGLFGGIVLIPLYLQNLMGYDAFKAGLATAPGGLATIVSMLIVGIAIRTVDPRAVIGMGLVISAFGFFLMSGSNLDLSFDVVARYRIVQGFGMGMIFVPLATLTFVGIQKPKMGNATGIFNLLRNIGSSMGISAVTTFLSRRGQHHQASLVHNYTPFNFTFSDRWSSISGTLTNLATQAADPLTASKRALGLLHNQLLEQSSMLAFNDCFWMITVEFLCLLPLLTLLRKGTAEQKPGPLAH
ncbi:MAG: DHA2 family efflux MFS transporter permease subunit [Nitrospirota bacterium]|nr:DHA2 family efflux MFS transporter permease subunit [Nitrospirota bacterium]